MNKILTFILSMVILCSGVFVMTACGEKSHDAIEVKIGNEVKGFKTFAEAQSMLDAEQEGVIKITLYKDLELSAGITLTNNEFELNLNGHDISAPNSQSSALIKVVTGAKLTINGTGVINSASQANDYSMAVWARGGEVIINGGTFTNVGGADFEIDNPTASNNNELLYVGGKDGSVYVGGTITINGGKIVGNYENETWSTRYTLNKLDADTNAQIIVKGGEFRQYNPAASLSEYPQANFVASGYKSTLETRSNIDWYVVSQEG